MATIIEGALWTLTENAAEHMVDQKLIYKCDSDQHRKDTIVIDLPVYHRRHDAPDWFGFCTIGSAIVEAEKAVGTIFE